MASVNEAERQELAPPDDTFGTIDDLDCRGRVVFLRIDAFVLDALADSRARREEPGAGEDVAPGEASGAETPARTSVEKLRELDARVIVATHLSSEDKAAARIADVEELASGLSEKLGVEALVPDEPVGDATLRIIQGLRTGQICVLPDLLAHPGEARNDERFARALAQHVDAYVGDAFASSHLAYASIARLPRLVPRRALGYRARREVEVASRLFASSRGSVAMVLGGSELGPRLGTVSAWLSRLDALHVGGAAAVTLLAAAGRAPASASAEPARLAEARSLLARARDLDVEVRLPVDFWVQPAGASQLEVVAAKDLTAEARVIDIGPRSLEQLSSALATVDRLAWWGPLGHLGRGGTEASLQLAHVCARPEVMSVVLGVETGRFVRQLPPDVHGRIDLVTTGTQALVALLSGQRLPGLEALRNR